jgi:hypothetical protein
LCFFLIPFLFVSVFPSIAFHILWLVVSNFRPYSLYVSLIVPCFLSMPYVYPFFRFSFFIFTPSYILSFITFFAIIENRTFCLQ